ncbi:schlafen family member 13-like [Athene cunicularia]|uniref:Schlafen family member 13-like n=1 Tax=Athene cunicularia TaxID=194338 RepID=A0A663MLT6_ATHCN|nr:schlafen family member 13-like [Athene cunicularia]XP_026717497.1 schlafen family member 13-like [Athene cunicularia]
MDLEDDQQQPKIRVNLATKYPEVVLCVGKICFGEKARKKIPKNSKQDQKYTLACAVCALLNSGGGVIKVEIENENYNLERDTIGLDLEETFRSLLLFPDWRKYLDFEQRDNYLFIFIKTWSSENSSLTSASGKPRICSLSTGLHAKCGASLSHMNSTEAVLFLKGKQDEARRELSLGPPGKIRRMVAIKGNIGIINNTVAELFNRDQLRQGETLTFTESGDVEFKHYSTENFFTRVKEMLPQYIAGFANTAGGYLWIGVSDGGRVEGFSSNDEDLDRLSFVINSIKKKLTPFHFCENGDMHNISYEHKILKVYSEAGDHCGYVCAIKIQPFTCVVFSEDPDSWLVEGSTIRRLRADEWAEWMTAADPDLSKFSETFRLELSLTEGSPLTKPVYSHKGLDNVDYLCEQLFPVKSHSIIYTPEKLNEDLIQEHPELYILMENQVTQLSEGVLIFSRSWAVEVGLSENQDIICDVLLIATGRPPILYTICKRHISKDLFEYSRRIAWKLKEKLVNTGGYIHKLCVIPKLLTLSPQTNCGEECDLNIQEMYPQNYGLINSVNLKALLHALTVALLTFKSFLSDLVGFEFLNLLTVKQYQLLSENLHKTKKLYVYGLPGTGKTIVALNIIQKIRTMLQCTQEEVLYICENQPLRDFVRQKNICQAVTRVAFLKTSFSGVKHIIVDEAQNFQDGEGDWYKKALTLTSSEHLPEPGFFWIFLDYLQKSHTFKTGLPGAAQHDPVESLTKVVRNANRIYSYLKENMEMIVKDSTLNIPSQRLESLLHRATCAHTVQGCVEQVSKLGTNGIAKYVVERCCTYLKRGYSEKDIAVLCYTDEIVGIYSKRLALEIGKSKSNISFKKMDGSLKDHAILDSIRRFSGLERTIVFGIIPCSFAFHREILRNILVCVASRANLNLHLIFEN